LNLGQMQTSADGKFVYFPWINYRHRPITASNIRQGWVLASRIARFGSTDRPGEKQSLWTSRAKPSPIPTGLR